jgi:hypothetical protein
MTGFRIVNLAKRRTVSVPPTPASLILENGLVISRRYGIIDLEGASSHWVRTKFESNDHGMYESLTGGQTPFERSTSFVPVSWLFG